MPTRLQLSILFLLFACLSVPLGCDDLTEAPAGEAVGGWAGSEESATIPDEILYFGSGNLPTSIDLTPYLPPVGDQSIYGTCVAWSAAYYGRTALYAANNGLSPALAEGRPVMFAAMLTKAFENNFWHTTTKLTAANVLIGLPEDGHAMTIVGYDDNRNAFRIVNS